ncbi:hypothetical protein [Rhizobium sp. Leaf306]|uniref:hypothetical protein n=1 Tax=Rhizobium sp. Leaf306 TaxID=1736330 RepID=UPI000A910782|nr:hypothetical protein [Rhizobium sp. Leaf306]
MIENPQAVVVVNEPIDLVASKHSPKYTVPKAWESVLAVGRASVKTLVAAGEAPFDRSLSSQFPNIGFATLIDISKIKTTVREVIRR